MAQNITLLGATYSAVPAVTLPKQSGGTAQFDDTTDADAVAEDIAKGKTAYVNNQKITGTAEGGSAELKMSVLRPDAELVQSFTYDKYIHADEGITIPAYTTTAQTLKASENLSPTVSMDLTNYNYYVVQRLLTIPEYSLTSKAKGRVEYWLNSALYEVTEYPANTFHALIEPTRKLTSRTTTVYACGAGPRLVYYTSSSAIAAYASAAYGPAQTVVAPSVSGTTLTVKSPVFIVRGHATYFVNTYMNALTDIRNQYVIEVYRAPKDNLNLDGWGIYQGAMHILDCIDDDGKLT